MSQSLTFTASVASERIAEEEVQVAQERIPAPVVPDLGRSRRIWGGALDRPRGRHTICDRLEILRSWPGVNDEGDFGTVCPFHTSSLTDRPIDTDQLSFRRTSVICQVRLSAPAEGSHGAAGSRSECSWSERVALMLCARGGGCGPCRHRVDPGGSERGSTFRRALSRNEQQSRTQRQDEKGDCRADPGHVPLRLDPSLELATIADSEELTAPAGLRRLRPRRRAPRTAGRSAR